ncbi:MAG: acyl-CoA dehydratase activase [Dehalococcoidia bacterium]|jgi:predicted CoA-substrate-specific enzyme activase
MRDNAKAERRLIYAGCDLGIRSAKVVIIRDGAILASEIVYYKSHPHEAAAAAMEGALRRAGISRHEVALCTATGFGVKAVRFADATAPDLICLLRGLKELNPKVRTVIDVGGHTLQVYSINRNGDLCEMSYTEDCAFSTGMFIETMSRVLEIPVEDMAAGSLVSENPVMITNTCVVFAESEAISCINEGCSRYDVFAGIILGAANKIASMAKRLDPLIPEVAMIGGVANYAGIKREVERQLGLKLAELGGVDPRIVTAYGAALLAQESGRAGTKAGGGR